MINYLILFLLVISFVWVAWSKPEITFAITWLSMFWLGSGFPSPVTLGPFQVNVMDIFLTLSFPLCFLRNFMQNNYPISHSIALLGVVIFVFQLLLVGIIFDNSVRIITADLRPFLYLIFFWVWVSCLINLCGINKMSSVFIYIFAIGAIGAALKAILILKGVIPTIYFEENSTIYLLEDAPLGASRLIMVGTDALCTIGVPFLLAYILKSDWSLKGKIFFSAALCASFLVLVLSFTRSTWVGIIVGSSIILLFGSKIKRFKFIVIFILSAIIVSFIFYHLTIEDNSDNLLTVISNRISGEAEYGGGLKGLTGVRKEEAEAILDSWAESPLLGKGFGGEYMFPIFKTGAISPHSVSHNSWLWLLLKGGIVGFLLFCYFLVKFFIRIKQLLKKGRFDLSSQPLFIGLMGGLVALSVMSLTASRLHVPDGGAFLGVWFAFMDFACARRKQFPHYSSFPFPYYPFSTKNKIDFLRNG